MQEAVTDVLAARYQQADRINRALTTSFAVHGVAIAALFILPHLLPRQAPPVVMTISLGGTPGPKVEGMTAASGRPVDEVVPQPKRQEPIPTATAKPSDATADAAVSVAKPRPTTPSPVAPPPKPAPDPRRYYAMDNNAPSSSKANTGKQITMGTAQADTGAKGIGTGLASGGSGGMKIDSDTEFCCPDYAIAVRDAINRVWRDLPVRRVNVVKFTIEKNGLVTGIEFDQSSGDESVDRESRRALDLAHLPPLPPAWTKPRLTIHLEFRYGGSW